MEMTIAGAGRAIRARTISSEELLRHGISRADSLDRHLGVYISRFDEFALAAARTADNEISRGRDRGPLHGIPIGVKDIISAHEGPTTGNSTVNYPSWREHPDAAVVSRLRAAGAVITGKLATSEFAIGAPDPTKPFPSPRNPWDLERYSGGSSSGSGSGIPAEMFLGALGTDTGGSIRVPAAYCGITGLKGTYGLVPKGGVMPLAPSMDVVGPMTRTAADAAMVLQAIAGHDPNDRTSTNMTVPDFATEIGRSIRGVRIAVERRNHLYGELVDPEMPPLFEEAVAELKRAGACISQLAIPYYRELTDSALVTTFCEGLAQHQRALSEQWEEFGRSTRTALAGGAFFRAHEYIAAQKVRRLGRRIVGELFNDVDLVVSPVTATIAPVVEGLDLSRIISTIFTPLWNGVGNPAVAIPMGFGSRGLPFGLQIVGRPFEDALVLRAANAYQRTTDWHTRAPTVLRSGPAIEMTHHDDA